jgi:hypothetical protein
MIRILLTIPCLIIAGVVLIHVPVLVAVVGERRRRSLAS